MDDNKAKWYILYTYSGYENIVESSINQIVANNGLEDKILDMRIPLEQVVEEKKDGTKKIVFNKIFPCYVYVKLVYDNDIWYTLTNIRGVVGFVGPQGRAHSLTDEEVQKLQLETSVDISSVDLQIGDTVNVMAGPLVGNSGVIQELDFDSQVANVLVSMFGRETSVELEFVQITKV